MLRDWVQAALIDPAWVWKLICAGALLVAVEFLRPGWVVPGCLGGLLLLAGLYGLVQRPFAPSPIDGLVISFTGVMLALLLGAARRARRNKLL